MNASEWTDLISQCDKELKKGESLRVRQLLAEIDSKAISDELRMPVAKICRRASLAESGIRILSPLVRESKNHRPATVDEIAEYCMCLKEIGSIDEAQMRLSQIEDSETAQMILCEMYIAFNLWDSQRAFEAADFYHNNFKDDEYTTAVVSVNKAAALIGIDKIAEARDLIADCIVEFQLNGWTRLLGNAQELMAQICIYQEDFAKAENYLQYALDLGVSNGLKDHLFIDRWKAVIKARQDHEIEPLMKIRRKALAQKHFETVRACDYERLKVSFDQRVLDRLYHGSPYQAYKAMLQKKFQNISDTYCIIPEAKRSLNLFSGMCDGKKIVKPGTKIPQLLSGLVADLYQPPTRVTLFHRTFPDEYFDTENSHKKLHQQLYRCRKWLTEHQLDFTIEEHDHIYSINYAGNDSLTIQGTPANTVEHHHFQSLSDSINRKPFTAPQAAEALGLSKTSAYRVLKYGIENSRLIREGFGCKTIYHFV